MGKSISKTTLLGNVGGDPEVRTTNSGTQIATFSLATSRSWKDASGEMQEKTAWHRLVAWGKTAEIVEKYVKKGDRLYVEGELEYRSYEDKEGVTKHITEIQIRELVLLGGGGGDAPSKKGRPPAKKAQGGKMDYEKMFPQNADDDLPW